LAGLSNAEADIAHRDDGVALGDHSVDGVVGHVHRAAECLEVPGHVVPPGELTGPRHDRIEMAHETGIVGELGEDVRNVPAPEGLEDPSDPLGVLDLVGGHALAPLYAISS